MRAEVRSGLDRASLLPVGTGYAELSAGVRSLGGDVTGYVRGEVGWRPAPRVSVFGFGEGTFGGSLGPGWMAGIGARVGF